MNIKVSASCLPGQILWQEIVNGHLDNLEHLHTPATKSKTIRTGIPRPLRSQKSFWDEVFWAITAVKCHGPFNIGSLKNEFVM